MHRPFYAAVMGTGCKVQPQGLVLLSWIWGCSERRDAAVPGLAWEWHMNPHLVFHSHP